MNPYKSNDGNIVNMEQKIKYPLEILIKDKKYSLIGLNNWIGGYHYTAYIKIKNNWWFLNDESSELIKLQKGGSNFHRITCLTYPNQSLEIDDNGNIKNWNEVKYIEKNESNLLLNFV